MGNASIICHGKAHLLPGGALQAWEHVHKISARAHFRVTLKLHQCWHLHGHYPTQHHNKAKRQGSRGLSSFLSLSL